MQRQPALHAACARIVLGAIAAGEVYAHDTLSHSCSDSYWRFTYLAVQQWLGVLPEWRYRIDRGCIDRVAADGPDLTADDGEPGAPRLAWRYDCLHALGETEISACP